MLQSNLSIVTTDGNSEQKNRIRQGGLYIGYDISEQNNAHRHIHTYRL